MSWKCHPTLTECEEHHHNGQSALNDIQSNQFTKLAKFFIRIRIHFLPTPSYRHGLIDFSNTTVSNSFYTTPLMHCEPTWRKLNIKISISAWCGQQLITEQVRRIWMHRDSQINTIVHSLPWMISQRRLFIICTANNHSTNTRKTHQVLFRLDKYFIQQS